MKALVYAIEDDTLGIPLTIEGELVDWEDETPPDIIINEIAYNQEPLTMWAFNETYIERLKDRIFQQWVNEK